jgi:hypothetical protein
MGTCRRRVLTQPVERNVKHFMHQDDGQSILSEVPNMRFRLDIAGLVEVLECLMYVSREAQYHVAAQDDLVRSTNGPLCIRVIARS